MVGLHVLNYKIIGLSLSKLALDIVKPLVGESRIDGIENGDLIVHYHVRIVAHALRHAVLSLKKIDSAVIDTYISDICRNVHIFIPSPLDFL